MMVDAVLLFWKIEGYELYTINGGISDANPRLWDITSLIFQVTSHTCPTPTTLTTQFLYLCSSQLRSHCSSLPEVLIQTTQTAWLTRLQHPPLRLQRRASPNSALRSQRKSYSIWVYHRLTSTDPLCFRHLLHPRYCHCHHQTRIILFRRWPTWKRKNHRCPAFQRQTINS